MTSTAATALRHRLADQRGEGVISTGIAVLIMALIGAAMWVAFSGTFDSASSQVEDEVGTIIEDGSGTSDPE